MWTWRAARWECSLRSSTTSSGSPSPRRHEIRIADISPDRLSGILSKTYEAQPEGFLDLLLISGVGSRTLRAVAHRRARSRCDAELRRSRTVQLRPRGERWDPVPGRSARLRPNDRPSGAGDPPHEARRERGAVGPTAIASSVRCPNPCGVPSAHDGTRPELRSVGRERAPEDRASRERSYSAAGGGLSRSPPHIRGTRSCVREGTVG